ncbi:type 2 isopentenyl-diphosphate Delta-isomerase [Roseomonas haemaphysalidis]|uniref:Isopentenyl-diphosphate delta-isomerase n=1 Tax=Roseomonas haemaphysalidis TaxID=2768162 RepID=A0ABS3KU01_9PROT|nr:type 2 isopentenyl-diphosphate Delta-isomerase [Roseomonas haemaphysalidis]MBO1080948.1 type 2 isopentenyl-diphosphate Delta-isomerase [Roseomonas haemaphysalidis]
MTPPPVTESRVPPSPPDIGARKDQHIDHVLRGAGIPATTTGLEHVRFEHDALPELALDEIDLSATLLGLPLAGPFLISSMTGGPARAAAINIHLAEAAQQLGVALAVGSQRIALRHRQADGLGADLRRRAPGVPLLANLGAVQFIRGFGLEDARRAVEMIGADALILHLNPLQEAVQEGGDHDWRGVLKQIAAVAAALPGRLVVKETGAGISARVAARLRDAGVAAIDVAGAGGTNWGLVEGARATDPARRQLAAAFAGWGISTARSIRNVADAAPGVEIIGSGGIHDGLDAARAIRLGAGVVGQAAGVLPAATVSAEAVAAHVALLLRQLRLACFCTGSADLAALRRAPLQDPVPANASEPPPGR